MAHHAERKRSVAEREAKAFAADRWQVGRTVNRLERLCYIRGRTADPSVEQVVAVGLELKHHLPEQGFDHRGEGRLYCGCGASFDDEAGLFVHISRACLEAAQRAAM